MTRESQTVLHEIESPYAAMEYLNSIRNSIPSILRVALISPAAEEYLQPVAVVRDPDTLVPSAATRVAFSSWKLLLQISPEPMQNEAIAKFQKLSKSAEKMWWDGVKRFTDFVLAQHKNAMLVRINMSIMDTEPILEAAHTIAANYNFIDAMVSNSQFLELAFVPLSVDPPAAMHYANAVSQLASTISSSTKWQVIACPQEARPFLDRNTLKATSIFHTIKRKLGFDRQ